MLCLRSHSSTLDVSQFFLHNCQELLNQTPVLIMRYLFVLFSLFEVIPSIFCLFANILVSFYSISIRHEEIHHFLLNLKINLRNICNIRISKIFSIFVQKIRKQKLEKLENWKYF